MKNEEADGSCEFHARGEPSVFYYIKSQLKSLEPLRKIVNVVHTRTVIYQRQRESGDRDRTAWMAAKLHVDI